jgi:hypothetical protein
MAQVMQYFQLIIIFILPSLTSDIALIYLHGFKCIGYKLQLQFNSLKSNVNDMIWIRPDVKTFTLVNVKAGFLNSYTMFSLLLFQLIVIRQFSSCLHLFDSFRVRSPKLAILDEVFCFINSFSRTMKDFAYSETAKCLVRRKAPKVPEVMTT